MLEEEKNDEIGLKVEEEVNNVHKDLSKGQKIAAAALGFFAFFIIIIWSLQFKNNFISPLAYQAALEKAKQGTESIESFCPTGQCSDLDEEALKTKDTDGDGLWDYDELNFYGTSPYLEDSDSDGFSDKEEIDSDNNPSCPAGRVCEVVAQTNDENAQTAGFLSEQEGEINLDEYDLEDFDQLEDLFGQSGASGDSSASNEAAELRNILRESGVSDEMLDLFSDDELLQLYQEALGE